MLQLFGKEISAIQAAASLGIAAVVYVLWRDVHFTFHEPRLWLVVSGVAFLVLFRNFIPNIAWAWWGWGVLTLTWSLAPGNTLVNSLWEILYLAALVAGLWRPGFWILNAVLLVYGLDRAILLNIFDLQLYVSGGHHYVAGAQALLLVPLSLTFLSRESKPALKVLLGLLFVASLYLALISGSRAVYLPLILVFGLTVGRLLVEGVRWYSISATLAVTAGILLVADGMIPNSPMLTALGGRATVEAQVASASDGGAFTSRLRYWDQTFDMALDYPFGTGAGSYQAIIHAYQKYPMSWSNSPHNLYVETVATGGWPRLLLLLGLLLPALWGGWRSKDWPWALAATGLWTTLAFDVTSYYPSFMMLAFCSVGAISGNHSGFGVERGSTKPVLKLVNWPFIILAIGLTAWWYYPCHGTGCAVERYLGLRSKIEAQLVSLEPHARPELLQQAQELYPKSVWVWRAKQRYETDPAASLAIAREIAQRFPYQHPQNYLDWANDALALGKIEEARQAIRTGLVHFPADEYPYGERRMTREWYQEEWVAEAQRLLLATR